MKLASFILCILTILGADLKLIRYLHGKIMHKIIFQCVNSLIPVQHQAIILTSAALLSIEQT